MGSTEMTFYVIARPTFERTRGESRAPLNLTLAPEISKSHENATSPLECIARHVSFIVLFHLSKG
jgi:hypothetical protein